MPTEWSDIIDGCLRQDRRAQRGLYERYFPYAMGVAVRYCNDRDQAVAVVNNAFLTVFKRLDRYDRTLDFKPWFRVIVVRAALDWLRKHNKYPASMELDSQSPLADREDILSRIGYQELLEMIRQLSAGYRAVFNLYVIDGFKHEEIAQKLGISVGTSKSNLFKARAHLRAMVQRHLEPNATPV